MINHSVNIFTFTDRRVCSFRSISSKIYIYSCSIFNTIILCKRGDFMFLIEVDEEVSLRMLTARDALPLFTLTNDSREHLNEWLPWVDMIQSEEDSLRFIKQTLQDYLDFHKRSEEHTSELQSRFDLVC